MLSKDYAAALAFDYCLLAIKPIQHAPFPFYKTGDFNLLAVGDEVYTNGYTNGNVQSFVSRGIVASKSVDTTVSVTNNGKVVQMPRSEALLNLTQYRSGGAIIKMGATVYDDELVGIANFITLPNGKALENAGPSPIGGCIAINHFLDGLTRMK
ncbi:MAG: hypothetical protein EOP47_28220 [Sphingobacteriaceae bacterium]|nr:MAG: hypothetical protein EOP47_28220 [Sphingobacteriaceae bacterium]